MSKITATARATSACTAGLSALLLILVSTTALHAQSGAVIHNTGGVSDSDKLNGIADTLGTTVTESPNKKDFLDKVKDSDVVYINSHTYKPKNYLHPWDVFQGRDGGLVVGDSAWRGRNDNDLVQPEDVRKAVKDRETPCKLAILAVCDTDKYGWGDAFGAKFTITTNRDVAGQAADVFFEHVIKGWKGGKTIGDAIDDSATYFQNPPADLPWSVRIPLKNFKDGLVPHGDPKTKYKDDPKESGHTHDANGKDASNSGHTHDKSGKDTSARNYYRNPASGAAGNTQQTTRANSQRNAPMAQQNAARPTNLPKPTTRPGQLAKLPTPHKLPGRVSSLSSRSQPAGHAGKLGAHTQRSAGLGKLPGRIQQPGHAGKLAAHTQRSAGLGKLSGRLQRPVHSARNVAAHGLRNSRSVTPSRGLATRTHHAGRTRHAAGTRHTARTPRTASRPNVNRTRSQMHRPARASRPASRPARMGRSAGGMRSAHAGGRGRRR